MFGALERWLIEQGELGYRSDEHDEWRFITELAEARRYLATMDADDPHRPAYEADILRLERELEELC